MKKTTAKGGTTATLTPQVTPTERDVLIVHYNTPEMTQMAIQSLRDHGGENYQVIVFDNSDSRPFTAKMDNVVVLDNRLGQLIDLDAELKKFPERSYSLCEHRSNFGSARHTMSVQYCWDILTNGFLLMDSDVIIRDNVDFMFDRNECCVGHIQTWQISNNPAHIDRLVPMLLWINVPMCKAGGAKFFDPERTFALYAGGRKNPRNWNDTGASFLDDIRTKKPQCHGIRIDIRRLIHHYQAASWRTTTLADQLAWLSHRGYPTNAADVSVSSNPDAKIYICAHKPFPQRVSNPIYETVMIEGKGDSFYSELAHMRQVCAEKKLPKYIGFCAYRKYFAWQDDIPDIAAWIKKKGCIVFQPIDLGMSVREQYDRVVGNVEDLDLATAIIDEQHKDFAPAWHAFLAGSLLHTASTSIMKTTDFRKMLKLTNAIVDEYLKRIGGNIDNDIEARILANPQKYHLDYSSVAYQRRIGGQLCERITSAYIDWKFPNAKEFPFIEYPRV